MLRSGNVHSAESLAADPGTGRGAIQKERDAATIPG